ncbi:MAG: sulfatase family protein [Planctomycetota bacterium]
MYRPFVFLSIIWVSFTLIYTGCSQHSSQQAAATPYTNFVLIFTDDQGYADVGCFGAKDFETPNLDRMAKEGMQFTDFHVAQAVCSASRAALMTGCYSNRVSILGALNPKTQFGLNPDEETIAEVLKKKGYAAGIFGKWHLGHHKPFLPLQQGFDEYLGLPYSNDMWPVDYDGISYAEKNQKHRRANYPILPLIEGNERAAEIRTLDDQTTLTTRYTERAVQFINKNKDKPFFLYVPHSMPHVPLAVSDKFKGKSKQGMYGDVIMEIDGSVGQILQALKKNGLEQNTLVIFASDNGPWMNYGNHAGQVGPLREAKATMWEGGARVPCIMRWPGHIKPASVCDKLAGTIDVLPTMAAIAEAPLPTKKIDGVSILGLLEGEKEANPRQEYYYYYGKELRAVRQGPWKLHFPHSYRSYENVEPGKDGWPGPYGKGKTGLALYNLQEDIGERKDVKDQHPEIVEQLKTLGEKARSDLGDSLTKRKGTHVREPGSLPPQKKI